MNWHEKIMVFRLLGGGRGFSLKQSPAACLKNCYAPVMSSAPGRAVSGDIVVDLEPGNAFFGKNMGLGDVVVRVVEGGEVEVDLIRELIGFIRNRRAAGAAKTPPDTGGGGKDLWRSGHVAKGGNWKADKGCNRGPRISPAAKAVAVRDPKGIAFHLIFQLTAETATGGNALIAHMKTLRRGKMPDVERCRSLT